MSNDSFEMAKEAAQPKLESLSPWWAVIFAIFVFFGAQFVAGLLVFIYPWTRHWSDIQSKNWLNSVSVQFFYILIAEALSIGAIYWFLKRQQLRFSSIGLKKPKLKDLLYGLAAVPVYFLLYVLTVGVVSRFVPGLNINQQQQIGFSNVHGTLPLVLTFISLVVLPPLAEEIMVRGFIYTNLKRALKLWPAAILTSLIFAVAHLPEGGAAGPLYIAALDTFVLSLVLIYLKEKTGSLWASITLHAAKNGIAFVALFVLRVH